MILPKLIRHHLKHQDDDQFYALQAEDAIEWLLRQHVPITPGTRALDLGCGHGIFGRCLLKRGCRVLFADESNHLAPSLVGRPFQLINLDMDDPASLGEHQLVVCSNVLEHLRQPHRFLSQAHRVLQPDGFLYLSWTNWLSPWGGHEFSPFHYLGPRLGPRLHDWLQRPTRKHTPFQNLFPTSIQQTLAQLKKNPHLSLIAAAPRYYPEFKFIVHLPGLRELLTWNCSLLLQRRPTPNS